MLWLFVFLFFFLLNDYFFVPPDKMIFCNLSRSFLVLIRSIPQAPYETLKNGVFHNLCITGFLIWSISDLQHDGMCQLSVATVWTWTLNDASWVGNHSRYTVSVLQFGHQVTHGIC